MLKFIIEENFKDCFYHHSMIDLICYQDLDELLLLLNVDTVWERIS